MSERGQGELFGASDGAKPPRSAPRKKSAREPSPAGCGAELTALAAELPRSLRFGTSSWAFPGWEGLVYADRCSETVLSRAGLHAYAAHPLLRAVGLDRTHYAPLDRPAFAAHAAQVGDDFRFLVKAHEACTLRKFPTHPRYGQRKGQENERFLDPDYAARLVVEPAAEGLGSKLGCILFQVAPQPWKELGGANAFVDRLHAFLGALPRGPGAPLYAVEVRNRELVGDALRAALADVGAVPALAAMGRLPPVREQAERLGAAAGAGPLVVRWMLHRKHDYEGALEAYEPFDRLVEEDEESREEIALLGLEAAAAGREVLVIVNNKAEGCSPLSIEKLARRVARGIAL